MAHPLADFYRAKRVLVTGHTGFLGGWMVAWLKLLAAQVCGYGLPPVSRPNLFDATLLDRGMTSIFADLRDRNSLASAFAEHQPEIVIHCATRADPGFSLSEPVESFSTNVMGTVHVLEEARLTPSVRAVVLVSRILHATQGVSLALDRDEDSLDIRDASRITAEMAGSAFRKCFFRQTRTAVSIARVAENDGGGDWREGRLIPKLVNSLISEEGFCVPEQRELKFWHVLEPVHACLSLAKELFESGQDSSRLREFGPDENATITATQVAEKFVASWEAGELSAPTNPKKTAPVRELNPNHQSSELQIGRWNTLGIDEAIAWSAEWYREYYAKRSSAWRITEDQITRYMERATVRVQQP